MGVEPTTEVMRINDLTKTLINTFFLSDLLPNKRMQARNTDPAASLVRIVIIITYVKKIVTVIKDPYPGQSG